MIVRKEVTQQLAKILDDHRPAWIIGCECMPIDNEGRGQVLDGSWENHVSEIVFNFMVDQFEVGDEVV